MKNKYLLWTIGLLTLVGCKKLSCEFSYSPTEPRAGEVVSFSNQSTGADDYYWTFGDNGTSTSSSPSHIYQKPGTYTVTLQIIRNKVEKRSMTKTILVYDTIPAIACDSDSVYSFTPVTFKAQVYNPWKKTITYHWTIPSDAVLLAGKSLDSSAIVCYFNQFAQPSEVKLLVQLADKPATEINYPFDIYHREGASVLFLNQTQATEQFTYSIYKKRVYSSAQSTSLTENIRLLDDEQDTLYIYGDSTYTIAKVKSLLKRDIKGFQVDRLMGKIYAYGESLWVCNMTGDNLRTLCAEPISAIKVDGDNNRIYWATASGLFSHPLMSTTNNQTDFIPQQVNTYPAISRISVNSNLH